MRTRFRRHAERATAITIVVACTTAGVALAASSGDATSRGVSGAHDPAMRADMTAPPVGGPDGAGTVDAVSAAPTLRAIAPPARSRALFIPPLLRPTIEGDTKVFALTARAGTIERFGETLATAGFNGTYLAPTIRVRRGDQVRVDVQNDLTEATTVHWHGLHVPATGDGGPYQPIPAGGSWHPAFEVQQQAASLWYHPHLMGETAPQVGRGMAGFLLIDDANPIAAKLPHRYGVDDVPLLFQGAPLAIDGSADTRRPLLINGTPNPVLRVSAGRVRLRLVNGTGGAILGVALTGATRVRMVASDGGLVPAPVTIRGGVVLGPSERVELVVDVRAGSRVQLRASILPDRDASAAAAHTTFARTGLGPERDTGTALTIVNTARRLGRAMTLPAKLNAAPALDLSGAVQRDMILGPTIQINGALMEHTEGGADMPGTLRIPLGQTEVWTITNRSPFTHVFHVHDIEFQVESRDGATPPAVERGWKDSIHVAPGHTVRIAMRFDDFADADAPYMFHCHVLRHEDAGMMGQFVVVPPGTRRRAA